MKTRTGAVVAALILAGAATAGVFLYVQNVQADAAATEDLVQVIAAKRDIPAGTTLGPLIDQGVFGPLLVPTDVVVPGAVTELQQLQGRTTNAFILEGEQISTARLQGTSKPTGGPLGIPEGMQAVSISLAASQAGGGHVQQGDHVSVYATFTGVELLQGTALQDLTTGKKAVEPDRIPVGDYTVTVVPDVQVLKIVGASTQTAVANDTQIQLTMALDPADAERLIFARERGSVWLGLVPPAEEGVTLPPVSFGDLLLANRGPA